MFNALAINALAGIVLMVGLWTRLASTLKTLDEQPAWAKPLRNAILIAIPRFALVYVLYSGLLDKDQARVVYALLIFMIAIHVPFIFEAFSALSEQPMQRLRQFVWAIVPLIGILIGIFGVAGMEWREPLWFNAKYIDGRLAPIGGTLSLAVLVAYGGMLWQIKHAATPRLLGTRRVILYTIAINLAVMLHDIMVAVQGLNNPYLSIFGVIAFGIGLVLAGEERAQLQIDDLRRKTHEAEAQAEARTSFLSHMSHQVRTPLTEIRGLQYLLQERAEGRTQAELAEALGTSAEILRTLIDDLLDYESIDAGLLELEHAPFAPKQLFDDLKQFAGLLPRSPELQLQFEYHGPDQIIFDRRRSTPPTNLAQPPE